MGIASQGVTVSSGSNLAIAGLQPSGVAAQGQVIWQNVNWAFVDSVTVTVPTTTSIAMDTTGVNLLVCVSTNYNTLGLDISDNKGNIWNTAIDENGGWFNRSIIAYCINPSVGVGHIFTAPTTPFSSFSVLAFSGPNIMYVDQISVTPSLGTGGALNPLTPSSAHSLVIAAVSCNADVASFDSGFIQVVNIPFQSGVRVGGMFAYLIQSTPGLISPEITFIGGSNGIAAMVSFKPS